MSFKNVYKQVYKTMVQLHTMDHYLNEIQRQGRISFYMQSNGEEAAIVSSAAALKNTDTIFAQYREAGALLWRGFTVQQCCNQCFGNADDLGKGRQMPVHYGSKEHHFHTISSPLTTQLPQAVGAAYSLKNTEHISAVYFGEGASSEGDFHAAMNFASVLECPVMFLCRNNQYAISTHSSEQYRGDGIISRAPGYGMEAIRVNGVDAEEVYTAVKDARSFIVKHGKPMLVEMMAYRIGHHSTSDDSTAYRSKEEILKWSSSHPIGLLKQKLIQDLIWDEIQDKQLKKECTDIVINAIKQAETKPIENPIDMLFEDVYDKLPEHLINQKNSLL